MPLLKPLAGRHPSWQLLLLGGALVIGGYFALDPWIGRASMILVVIPLYYFAGVYGRWGGAIATLMSMPCNLLLFYLTGGMSHLHHVGVPFWASSIAMIPLFYQIGIGHELRWRLARELERSNSLAQQLREERDRVQRASESKDALLMSISHDLRSPLSAIIQSTQLIEAAPHTTVTQADLIRRTSRRLLTVVNDLLRGYHKLANPHGERAAPFQLEPLLDEIVRLNRPLFEARHLRLELHIAPELPPWFEGHAAQVHRILANLLGNSLKHTDSGGAQLRADLFVDSDGAPWLQIAVIDSGKGIPSHRIGPLLAAARAAPIPTQVTEGAGYGLGLGNCLRLCEQIGAQLLLQANSPRGLQALLRLPWRLAQAVADEPSEAALPAAPASAGPRTLVVDDEEATAATLTAMLQQLDCPTRIAADGAAALRELDTGGFGLAFLDLQLPDIDGRRLAAKWRQRAPDTFLVLFSANILLTDLDLWLNLDVDMILSKPITLHELGELISLSGSGRDPAPRSSAPSDEPLGGLSDRHCQLLSQYLEQSLFAYGRQDLAICAGNAHKLASAAATLQLAGLSEQAARAEELALAGKRIPLFPELRRLAAATRVLVQSPATPARRTKVPEIPARGEIH
jgi:signal transduction histidine kinase/DNA-binding NarL/FixJ family response regulator